MTPPHVAFITSVTPTGSGEAFVAAELAYLKRAGLHLTVAPIRLDGPVFHADARAIEADSLLYPLFDAVTLFHTVVSAVTRPLVLARATGRILWQSGSVRATLKNLVALPKACRLAAAFRRRGITHVHGAWASVPASVAWLLGRLLGVPWSFTAIRWDVDEANLLGPKIREAAFVRAPSDGAKRELLRLSGLPPEYGEKVMVIPHGVPIGRPRTVTAARRTEFQVVSVGYLVPKKGHRFLVEACRLLQDRQVPIRCTIIGSGPLQSDLEKQIVEAGLEAMVAVHPFLPHDDLLKQLSAESTDLLVYPSIVADDGQREGIPVTLVEALALGVPVLSTPTGDIPELLGGIPEALVPPGDAERLAEKLHALWSNRAELERIGQAGRAVVAARFDMAANIGGVLRELLSEQPASAYRAALDSVR